VERLLRGLDTTIPYKAVHATRGKLVRAEPVAALYEQERVHHIGVFPELETQMTTYTGERLKPSPDRLDALVWGLSELSKSRGTVEWRVS
jgi:phage terminase large subunit-like protein